MNTQPPKLYKPMASDNSNSLSGYLIQASVPTISTTNGERYSVYPFNYKSCPNPYRPHSCK